MSHVRIRNPELYANRTVQDWHYDVFPLDNWAIDLDLMGACSRCRQPLYLIEATTNGESKPTTILRSLAERANLAAFVIFHDVETKTVTHGRMVWPRTLDLAGPTVVKTMIHAIRQQHMTKHHNAIPNREKAAQ